jgi:hypothetical protein
MPFHTLSTMTITSERSGTVPTVTSSSSPEAADGYREYAGSAEYLHLLSAAMWTSLRPRVTAALCGVDPQAGPVVEWGAGTGLGTDVLLDVLGNDVLTAEPAAELRGILLARLADRGALGRVTVHPGTASDLPLPDRLAGIVGLNMIGHLAADERARLWADAVARLAPGGPVVLNVQPPETAIAVPPFPWFGTTVGELTYEGRGEAHRVGPGLVQWRMSYRTRRGNSVLTEAHAEYDWYVLSAPELAAELAAAGLDVTVDSDLVVARMPPEESSS